MKRIGWCARMPKEALAETEFLRAAKAQNITITGVDKHVMWKGLHCISLYLVRELKIKLGTPE